MQLFLLIQIFNKYPVFQLYNKTIEQKKYQQNFNQHSQHIQFEVKSFVNSIIHSQLDLQQNQICISEIFQKKSSHMLSQKHKLNIEKYNQKEHSTKEFITHFRFQDKLYALIDKFIQQQHVKDLIPSKKNLHNLQQQNYQSVQQQQKNVFNNVSKDLSFISSLKNKIEIFSFSQCRRQKMINMLNKNDEKKLIRYIESKKENSFGSMAKQRIIGGGQCCSRQDITQGLKDFQQQNSINQQEDKKLQIDIQFQKFFDKNVANKFHISEIVDKRDYATEIISIFDKCLNKKKEQITVQTNQYRIFIIEMFNLCFQYVFSGAFDIDKDDSNQIISKIDIFLSHIKQNINLFPCLDLEFLYQFLYDLCDLEFDQNSQSYKNVSIIAEFYKLSLLNGGQHQHPLFINEKHQLNQESGKSYQNFLIDADKQEHLDNVWQVVDKAHEKIRSFTKYSIAKQVSLLLELKTQRFYKQQQIQASDELIFFIEQVIEQQNIQASSRIIIYLLIQIHCILLKNINNSQFMIDLNNLFEVNQKLNQFLRTLQQQSEKQQESFSERFLLFFKFTVTDITYRFLSNQILMLFYQILASKGSQQNEYLFTHLVHQYLTEKNESIKLIFLGNQAFVSTVNEEVKKNPSRLASIVVKYQNIRKQQMINNKISQSEIDELEETIKDESDFLEKISLRMIEKWELNARQRLEKGIAQKDDILLEVQDLYIDQNIAYMSGSNIFEGTKIEQKDLNIDGVQRKYKKNAIDLIISQFLLPHQNKSNQIEEKQNISKGCKILGILAEGGTGKSMLFKRLETLLMKEKNSKMGSQLNYITFLIKCNNLDSSKPSLDDYFLSQGLDNQQINLLKQTKNNKLILLDGYDEYSGNYFRIYYELNLSEWKNTVVIVSSRMEKLSETDAQLYFSIDDSQMVRDETSYCIVKLQEFMRKDVDQYCKKFFEKQTIKQQQIQINENQFLSMMEMCLNNKQLENLLFLPINLYLFTRMVINKKQEELSDIIHNITDQIQIQEIFFQEQFQREAVDFIDQIQESQANKQLIAEVVQSFFVYFQSVAMQMFLNKGFKANFLQLTKEEIVFHLQPNICNMLKQEDQSNLQQKIVNYVNSKIITKVKDNDSEEEQVGKYSQIIEFKHKSLFEYFVARAFKYDFDIHGEEIYNLEMQKLIQFNINKKIVMNLEKNKSEQQVLVKFYRLIKQEIESESFIQNYSEKDITKTNRFIQYLRRSTINKITDVSEIDRGASNLLSTLFISKFAFEELSIAKCSFSKSYLPTRKSFRMNFDQCNFNYSYLENQNLCSFESSLTKNAMINSCKKEFDMDDVYQSNGQILYQDKIFSVSKSGYINSFSIQEQVLLGSKKVCCQSIKAIVLEENNLFLYSQQSLFEVNPSNLETVQSFKFPYIIKNIQYKNNNYLVNLENKQTFYGNISKGFKQIQLEGQNHHLVKEFIISYQDYYMLLFELQSFQLKKKLDSISFENIISNNQDTLYVALNENQFEVWQKSNNEDLLERINYKSDNFILPEYSIFSYDSKYFVILTVNNAKVWNVENDFELVFELDRNENINSFHFSRDSKYLSISSQLFVCQILDIQNDFQVKYFISAHTNKIGQIQFSSDGKYLATCSDDSYLRVWDPSKSYSLLHKIKAHDDKINSLSFSPNGTYLATCSIDNFCKIWNISKQFELTKSLKLNQEIIHLTFSPDQKYLVLSLYDNSFNILNPNNNFSSIKIIDKLKENESEDYGGWTMKMSFSANSKYLAAYKQKDFFIFDVEQDFDMLKQIQGHSNHINDLCFSKDNKYMVTVSDDKICKIWKVNKEFNLIKQLSQHKFSISSTTFSPDSKYLLTLAEYEGCIIYDSEKDFEIINIIHDKSLILAVFNPLNSKYFATTCIHGTFQVWNIEKSYESIKILQSHNNFVKQADFYNQNTYLATYANDKDCRVWTVNKGFELKNTFKSQDYKIQSAAFSPDGKYLALGVEGNACQIWNLEQDFKQIKQIQQNSSVQNIIFSFDGKYLTILTHKQLDVYLIKKDFEHIRKINIATFYNCPMTYSKDSAYFSIGEQNTCRVWDINNEFQEIYVKYGHGGKIYQVIFSSDNKYYASVSYDKRCNISDISDNFKLIKTIQNKKALPLCAAFSLDSKYLIIGFDTNCCEVYHTKQDFVLLNVIYNYEGKINYLSFSPCGKYLALCHDLGCKILDSAKGLQKLDEIQNNNEQSDKFQNINLFAQLYEI
ncbi:WD domain, G-beta repeat protein (macronuclear) [Tetrahymena thermophila SB210]|uniref:WD domain, G-beta repeat protein n=1 Tax=Tetrahymena thermophila (strain SB210) TaxID=312017 RepID=I7M2D1_TETTS|nr:WD domain, G-beta repeat protein [Tetrahymena thermophila SB210]EAR99879.2 WD domain, G-beta repeat protein [Tetrahymena thermophila SB210]|eukprot:XP_001020124.2 WD domain, G-beta repeat protein [Tetrahymena thermophila SB210]